MPEIDDRTLNAEAARVPPAIKRDSVHEMTAALANSSTTSGGSLDYEIKSYFDLVEAIKKEIKNKFADRLDSVCLLGHFRDKQTNDVRDTLVKKARAIIGLGKDQNAGYSLALSVKQDVVDYVPGTIKHSDEYSAGTHLGQLDKFINPAIQPDPNELAEALSIAAHNAQYKFTAWQSTRQIISLVEKAVKIARLHPEAKPAMIELAELRQNLALWTALVEVDLETKPHYRNARPELLVIQKFCREQSEKLCEVFAA